jgi:hypothetical protein
MADCEDTINWYPEMSESQGAKAKIVLYPTPGMEEFSAGTQAGRALFSTAASGGRTFLVEGTSFVELAETGVRTVRGTVSQDANPATITTNGDGGDQLFITSGSNGYNFDLNTNTLTAIANLAGKATMGGFACASTLPRARCICQTCSTARRGIRRSISSGPSGRMRGRR